MGYVKPPPERPTPSERVVHELHAMDLVTGPPEIGQPTLGVMDDREKRRALRTNGGGVGVAIAASALSAAGSGQASAEGVTVQAAPPEATAGGEAPPNVTAEIIRGGFPLQVHDAVSKTSADEVQLTYHPPPEPAAVASSRWTGRLSVREQVLIVKQFAPLASGAVDELAAAIRDGNGNDPAYAEALTTLKELHRVLGDLISRAERGEKMTALLRTFERKKRKLGAILADNAALILVDPLRAFAAAATLEGVSNVTGIGNVQVDATLIGVVYGALIGRDVLTRTKGK